MFNDPVKKSYSLSDIKAARQQRRKEHRILLLGCGQAGKSTFIKQMRVIHSGGFEEHEKGIIKLDIASNIATAIMTLIDNSLFDENPKNDADKKLINAITQVTSALDSLSHQKQKSSGKVYQPSIEMVFELADDIRYIWESGPIQNAYAVRNTFQLADCAKYFLSKVNELMNPDYVVTNNDITQTRVQTTGIVEHEFEIKQGGPACGGKIIMVKIFHFRDSQW